MSTNRRYQIAMKMINLKSRTLIKAYRNGELSREEFARELKNAHAKVELEYHRFLAETGLIIEYEDMEVDVKLERIPIIYN